MYISTEFKRILDDDIKKCKEALEKNNRAQIGDLYDTLYSKYGKIIDGFTTDLLLILYDETGSNCRKNIDIMCQKLELFKAMGYKNQYSIEHEKNSVSVTNTNTNTNNNNVNIGLDITFSQAKEKVESMSALQEEEIAEILAKIDEIEQIVNSSERKTQKWAKAKEIVKWVADKGVDVGVTLLPLILKLGQ